MHRGCFSDQSLARSQCDKNDVKCNKCLTDGCNNEPMFKAPTLSCMRCNDSAECAFGADNSKRYKCSRGPLFGEVETCYILTTNVSDLVERGCTFDRNSSENFDPKWCENNEHCTQCNSTYCNDENVRFHSCAVCDSISDNDCANPNDISKFFKPCANSTYPFDKRGCYSLNYSKLHLVDQSNSKLI